MKEIEEINDNLETKEEAIVLKSTKSTKEVIEAAYLEALKSQNVVQHSLEDVAKSTYLDYSMSVIVGRAIPDVRDGLKPVHRRILYAMNNDLNITAKSSYVKSAKVVGTCLVGGTLVSTPKGLVKIENINVGDKVFTQTGIENVSKLFYQPKQKILNISLNGNIYSNQSTFDHKFKTLNENCEYEFVEASKLKENDYLILKPSLIDLEESIYNNEETYVLGMLLADGNLDRNKQKNINYLSFTNNDLNILNKINNYFGGSFNIRKSNTTYRLKISNKELTHNFIKKFDLINKYSYTIHNINDYLNKFSNENLFSFVSGFIDGDGFIRKDRNEITISSVDDKFLSYLSKLIFDRTGIYSYMTENITSKDGKIYQDRIIKANYNIYNIIFSGKNAYDLSLKLNLFSTKKKNRLLNISQSKITLSNIIPFYGKKIFELFKEKHLGGGWYLDTNNKKFRDGIKYQNGAKIRYPKDLNNTINLYSDNIDKLNILKKLQKLDIKLYNELKEIINSKILFIPISKIEEVEEQFTYDFTVDNKHEFIANGMMSSNCLGSYHPHGDISVYDAMVGMSQDFNYREPLLDGQGNWGNIDGDSAAAMRYCVTGDTMIKTTKGLIQIKNLVKDSTMEEQDINVDVYSLGNNINKATKFFNSGKHNIIEITTKNGYKLKGSENHPVLTLQKDENGKPYYFWKQLSLINENDYLLIDRNDFDSKNKSKDIDKAIIYACLITEGSISEKRVTFVNTDLSLMNKFVESYEKVYDKKYYLYSRVLPSGKTIYEFDVQNSKSTIFNCEIFEELKNLKSKNKIIPNFIFKSNQKIQKVFLQIVFECDGSISYMKNDNYILINYDSISLKLIEQIKLLLLNFGVFSKINFQKRDDSYKIYLGNQFNTQKFINKIGFFTIKKFKQLQFLELIKNDKKSPLNEDKIPFISEYIRNKYNNIYLNKNNIDNYLILNSNKKNKIFQLIDNDDKNLYQNFIDTNYFYDKILKINKLEEKESVYSIRVDSDCHSFIGNGIVNHNTEVRLSPHGYSLLNNIEKKSVKFRPNFDDSTEEPDVLPAMLPNILINGTEGIAVGMATNMASHNANEIIEATIASIKNPDISIDELRKYIKGPDMPTGGIIMKDSMDNIYTHGIGRFYVKAKYHVEDEGRKIVITEIPFQVNKPNIVVQIAELVRNKQVGGIVGAQDESNKEGLRLVISIKRGENVKIIMNTLFKKTDLQRSYSIKNLVINEEKEPVILNLKEILTTFINFRKQVVTKDFEFDINKLEKRAHLLRGIVIALNNLDRTLEIIRASNNSIESKDNLIKEFNIDEAQSQAIIDTKLQKLSNMETTSIFNELNEIEVEINKLSTIISTDKELSTYIINELKDLNKKFKSPRKSLITDEEPFISNEALITDEDVAIIITKDGFIRKTPLDNFKAQHRGGKGKTIITLRDGDYVKNVLFCKNNEHLTIFTKNNKAFILPVYTVTESSKGRLVTNLIEDDSGVFDIIHTTDSKEMLFVTEKGQMIKLSGKHFIKIRANGIKAIQLNDNDKLIKVLPINETDTHLMAITKDGITMTTSVKSFRTLGRGASGVKGISIRKGDMVVDACIVNEENKVLLISEKGYGKQNLVSDFRVTNRGSKGVKSFKISDKTGNVVGIIKSKEDQDLVVTTKKGIIIRTPLNKVSTNNGRVTVGVKIIDLKDDDEVISFDAYEQMEIFED